MPGSSSRRRRAGVTSFAGEVVPEPLVSRGEYEERVYAPIRRDLERIDPAGILQPEWSNARGAIARFDRGAIEIRLIDPQECPRMDLAVAALVVAAIRLLVEQGQPGEQRAIPSATLGTVLADAIRAADDARVEDPAYLAALGLDGPASTLEAWERLRRRADRARPDDLAPFAGELDRIFERGPLARRILRATGAEPTLQVLRSVYRRLADCLERGKPFAAT